MNVEALLREALTPVEPPLRLSEQLESTLTVLTEAAQEELDGWELAAMRDPRNWVRPVVAASVTLTAGTALVALRVRARQHARRGESSTLIEFAERTLPRHRRGSPPGPSGPVADAPVPVCYRHPSRETGVSCSNCGRPICPDCMTPTSVGMRCPDCAGAATKVRRARGSGINRSFARPPSLNDPRTWSVTQMLIAANVLVFLWEVAGGLTLGGGFTHVPYPYYHGVLYGPWMSHGVHQYWRLLTSGFLHESIIHIGFNMLSLWFVGRALEPAIGKTYFAAIYFTALLAGSFGALLFTPDSPTLGASGAIFGIFGALIMVARARRISLWQSGLLPILIFNLVYSLSVAGVSIGGHLFGVTSGFITGWLVTEYGEKRDKRSYVLLGCLAISILSVVGAIAVAGNHGLLPGGSVI